ncbi:hypothetical protein DITRI_Ditri07aG0161200 [Diplodiscus trichospermus]
MDAGIFLVFSIYNSLVLLTVMGIIVLLLSDGLFGLPLFLFIIFLASILPLYWQGKNKIQKLCYNADKCPIEEAAAEEDQSNADASTAINESSA